MPRKKFDRSLLPEAPNLEFEQALWDAGVSVVAGVDEAGRGALAGPVAAGVVVLPNSKEIQSTLAGVRDSKQISQKKREEMLEVISRQAVSCQVGFGWPEEIDRLGIVPATRLAAVRALKKVVEKPGHLLIDAISIPEAAIEATSLIKGDQRALSIAAASIAAKVTRDAYMVDLAAQYPGYGFEAHKGYGTLKHRQSIERLGPSAVHRMSFAPMREEDDEEK
ncbi:MAG: ribonuclease HII [Chloroflexota bacterium]